MTNPNRRQLQIREVPSGWPVGSFDTYAEAQEAVDSLSDREFPVEKLTIVGVDLMQVENITGRLTWGRVLGGGALSGLWMGMFIGLIFALFAMPGTGWSVLVWSLLIGAVFGLVFAAIAYAFSGGRRDFSSATAIVAGHYDVLCEADMAPQARDLIAAGARGQRPPEQPAQPERPAQPEQPNNAPHSDNPGGPGNAQ
ncbi:hypothetical protein CGLAUT_04865 [Corynebacterium glaucum]|uniref:general stress protein n=1 Tax=Corynebacterium glaucum TaxID=187491 RepID=UPI0025B39C05|nr:general stress protein [Corynebacterium glaucum]WJZ07471.1 hypothetical protein CGLAUT_04865 [Corynebacterium glaucum]